MTADKRQSTTFTKAWLRWTQAQQGAYRAQGLHQQRTGSQLSRLEKTRDALE